MSVETVWSPALGEPLRYLVHAAGSGPHGLLLLLHGRGGSADSWAPVLAAVDDLVRDGVLPPQLVVAPEGQWSGGGHFWVDSAYDGEPRGARVGTALLDDLLPHLEHHHELLPGRTHRVVGGYSMGGAGALHHLLGRPDLFGAGLALSPASYDPLPPAGSSARAYGAFGRGQLRFDPEVYRARSYAVQLRDFDARLPVRLFLAVGEAEWRHPDPADRRHDLDRAAAAVHARATATPGVDSHLDLLPGGHDWSVWLPAAVRGLRRLCGRDHRAGVS